MSHYPFIARCLLSVFVIMCGTAAHAQAFDESEPNDVCSAAQAIGTFDRPSTVTGSLGSTLDAPDVDFFSFQANADEMIQVDLEGAFTGAGTLANPLLGLFNSECVLLAANDDSGGGSNSRLVVTVPFDGNFILGVTECCDYTFEQGGFGSYLLTVDTFRTIESISGRLVNANPGNPGPSQDPAYASVYLLRCSGGDCYEYVSYQQADNEGRFSFQQDWYGGPLSIGTYQIVAYANGFESFVSMSFDVAEDEAKDLGELGLVPIQLIGSVSGRLVDAITGNALPGNGPPYAYLYLERCEDWGCYYAAYSIPDDSGYFRFDGLSYYLSPGTYRLSAFAQDYRAATSNQFAVDAFADVYFGDFALTPFPIQFGATQACEIPFGSETCDYSIQITNRGAVGRYKGQAWSTVEFYDPTNYAVTRFQVGRNGTQNPMPEKINLKRGQSETLTFQLDVPASVPVGSTVCASISVGQQPHPQFNSQGDRPIFCSYKQSDGVVAMSAKESRKWLEKRKNRDRQSNGLQNRGFDESRPF